MKKQQEKMGWYKMSCHETTKRYEVKDYYIWDNINKCQVILFDHTSKLFHADKVCEMLNEHEAMKKFFIAVAEEIKGDK